MKPEKKVKGLSIASGIFDLLGTLMSFAVCALFVVCAVVLAGATVNPDGTISGLGGIFTGSLVAVSGIVITAIFYIVAAFMLVVALFWLACTIKMFLFSKKDAVKARRSTVGITVFAVFQTLAGLGCLISPALRVDGAALDKATLIVTIILGFYFLLCAALKIAALVILKKVELPPVDGQTAYYQNAYNQNQYPDYQYPPQNSIDFNQGNNYNPQYLPYDNEQYSGNRYDDGNGSYSGYSNQNADYSQQNGNDIEPFDEI